MRRISVSPAGFGAAVAGAFGLGAALAWAVLAGGGDGAEDGRDAGLSLPDPAVHFPAPSGSMAVSGGAPVAEVGAASSQAPGGTLPDVDSLIAGLRVRLQRNPSDADGWLMLGWSLANTGRAAEAVPAYGRAAELRPDDAETLGQYGAALVAAADGRVDAAAAEVFDRVLRLAPGDGRGLYYAGLARLQGGEAAAGDALLRRALAAAPPDAPWLPDLRSRLGAP